MSIPGAANPLLLASKSTAYTVSRSVRLNSADSAYFSRTPASQGNRRTWTYSCWVKRAGLGTDQALFDASNGSPNDQTRILFDSNNKISFSNVDNNSVVNAVVTTPVYRDCSAFLHLVIAIDTTQSTSSDRVKIYVNGVQVTVFDTANYPGPSYDTHVNRTYAHAIGRSAAYSGFYHVNAYLADVIFVDGQQLTPSSFTETSATTGQLIPKKYTGTFTGNSFWLPFSDNSSTTSGSNVGIGKDFSGLGNYWNTTNLSVTAGAGNDSLVDTPTSYGTDTGAGGEVRGNYCTLNPLDTGTVTLTNGNLDVTFGTAARGTRATFGITSGKYYFEMTNGSSGAAVGVAYANANITTNYAGSDANAWIYNGGDGKIYNNGAASGSNALFTTSDIIGVAINMDAGVVTFYKNNSAQPTTVTGLSGTVFPVVTAGGTAGVQYLNFGQRPFAYTAPSGFKALCDTNLPAPVVAKSASAFDVKLYTGNGSTQTISGLNFSSDLIWIKSRSNAYDNVIQDSVRGITSKYLITNSTAAEADGSGFQVTAVTDTSFSVGAGTGYNTNAATYAAWCWDAGSSTVSNTQGSITSSVRANTSSGFSVVSWSGVAGANGTIGHGLGVAPQFVILKNRGTADNWRVYHVSVGATGFLQFASTGATVTSDEFQNTSPTSTVFYLRGNTWNAASNNYIAYFFAPVAGYSSFGSYTGNGSTDGPFVYTGFRPRWLMVKKSSAISNWWLIDTARDAYNASGLYLSPDIANAESDNRSSYPWDILSNGFKLRVGSVTNDSGATYVWAAFAESPFAYSRAR